jgi:hypothetical protein
MSDLFSKTEKDYGDEYKTHLFEQYKLYVEMADKISERRQSANSFFLTVNTAIVGLTTYFAFCGISCKSLILFSPISIAGLVICFTWYRLIRSYKDLNTAKFKVIHEIEQKLPFAPYDLEWEKVGRGKNPELYLPFTHIEICVPWVFFSIHAFVVVFIFLKTVGTCRLIGLLW